MKATQGGEVEHPLQGLDALGVGVGEGVVEDDGQAAIVIGGEDFGHGEPGSGGHLFFGSAAEGVEVERVSPGTDEVEAFDAGF